MSSQKAILYYPGGEKIVSEGLTFTLKPFVIVGSFEDDVFPADRYISIASDDDVERDYKISVGEAIGVNMYVWKHGKFHGDAFILKPNFCSYGEATRGFNLVVYVRDQDGETVKWNIVPNGKFEILTNLKKEI